jgi:hypothetical protein
MLADTLTKFSLPSFVFLKHARRTHAQWYLLWIRPSLNFMGEYRYIRTNLPNHITDVHNAILAPALLERALVHLV